jgi:hypothetical protein
MKAEGTVKNMRSARLTFGKPEEEGAPPSQADQVVMARQENKREHHHVHLSRTCPK